MFAIISKLSLKMQRNDLILPVVVLLLQETIANVDALKLRPIPNGDLKRFMNMLEESGVHDEVQFQGHMSVEGGWPTCTTSFLRVEINGFGSRTA